MCDSKTKTEKQGAGISAQNSSDIPWLRLFMLYSLSLFIDEKVIFNPHYRECPGNCNYESKGYVKLSAREEAD